MTPLVRVLVVDDSPVNRHVISEALIASGRVNVVGHASNGEQALRMVAELAPDAISLDVEMPKMDGFTFLRILMATRALPVVVLSGNGSSEAVFKALELGAVDFVAKPGNLLASDALAWRKELVDKLLLAQRGSWRQRRAEPPPALLSTARRPALLMPRFVVAVASSTGGPGALLHILSRLPATYPGALLIAQHMAPIFTRTFAARLDRTTGLSVQEAKDGDVVHASHVYVCPGGMCMLVRRDGNTFRLELVPPDHRERYVPSGNRLMSSLAEALGNRAVGLVLTGMADDGLEGARAIRKAGGSVIVESEDSAVVFGMPGTVAAAGLANKVLPLRAIAEELALLR